MEVPNTSLMEGSSNHAKIKDRSGVKAEEGSETGGTGTESDKVVMTADTERGEVESVAAVMTTGSNTFPPSSGQDVAQQLEREIDDVKGVVLGVTEQEPSDERPLLEQLSAEHNPSVF